MSSILLHRAHVRTVALRRAMAILAGALVCAMAFTPLSVAPTSARTFDISPNGSLVLNPLPPQFACAMKRVLANRQVACH